MGAMTAQLTFSARATSKENDEVHKNIKMKSSSNHQVILEMNGRLVDLSNLLLADSQERPAICLPRRNKKQSASYHRRLYPSVRNVEAIQDVDVTSSITKARLKRHHSLPAATVTTMTTSSPIRRRQTHHSSPRMRYGDNHLSRSMSMSSSSSYHSTCSTGTGTSAFLPPLMAAEQSSVTTTTSHTSIEIQPGVYAPLRGVEETLYALETGLVVFCDCLCCCTALVCSEDADFVLCPRCKVVSPIRDPVDFGIGGGAVGLGLRR